jgi:lactoylglutathione lyase
MSEETIRIAVGGTQGGAVDQHFGQAAEFLIYDVTVDGVHLLDRRGVDAHAQDGEDRRDTIVRMLGDCQALLVAKIGPVPQAKLAAAGIVATDAYAGQPIETALLAFRTNGDAGPTTSLEDISPPPDFGRFRLLHTMLRVSDMERSVDFYTRLLGMRVLDQREHKKNQFTQVYLGYGDGASPMVLELVFNWMRETPYQKGDAFGHIALDVNGIGALCRHLAAEGVVMPRPPRSQRHRENIVAFIEDPDGYQIELVQSGAESAMAVPIDHGAELAISA